jgi:hypothetical protein
MAGNVSICRKLATIESALASITLKESRAQSVLAQ